MRHVTIPLLNTPAEFLHNYLAELPTFSLFEFQQASNLYGVGVYSSFFNPYKSHLTRQSREARITQRKLCSWDMLYFYDRLLFAIFVMWIRGNGGNIKSRQSLCKLSDCRVRRNLRREGFYIILSTNKNTLFLVLIIVFITLTVRGPYMTSCSSSAFVWVSQRMAQSNGYLEGNLSLHVNWTSPSIRLTFRSATLTWLIGPTTVYR